MQSLQNHLSSLNSPGQMTSRTARALQRLLSLGRASGAQTHRAHRTLSALSSVPVPNAVGPRSSFCSFSTSARRAQIPVPKHVEAAPRLAVLDLHDRPRHQQLLTVAGAIVHTAHENVPTTIGPLHLPAQSPVQPPCSSTAGRPPTGHACSPTSPARGWRTFSAGEAPARPLSAVHTAMFAH